GHRRQENEGERREGRIRLDPARQRHPVHIRHLVIDDRHIVGSAVVVGPAQALEGAEGAGHAVNVHSPGAELARKKGAVRRVVVDTQTRRRRSSAKFTCLAVGGAGRLASRTVNQNVLPLPTTLSTPMAPPIISTSRLEIASPRPVPPYRRVMDPSAWGNDWKNRSPTSGATPIPVSVTEKRTKASSVVCSTSAACTTTSPHSVNLTALPTRLVRICRRRPGSPPIHVGRSALGMYASSRPLP